MASGRKVCVFKNCETEAGRTLFKFPSEPERFKGELNKFFCKFKSLFTFFLVWCVNAGIVGDVDITRTRYLCEKHFSTNYISTQARRKMLVHTAVPAKWKESIKSDKVSEVNIVGEPPNKKRKMRDYTYERPKVFGKVQKVSPEKRTLINKVSAVPQTAIIEETVEEEEESEQEITLKKQSGSEIYEIEEISKQDPTQVRSRFVNNSTLHQNFKEITLQAPVRGQKMKYLIVKPKQKLLASSVKIPPPKPEVAEEEEATHKPEHIYIVEEDPEIPLPNLELCEETFIEEKPAAKVEPVKSPQPSSSSPAAESLENYSEFIFNNEKYVQMPKRIFEAEKEKLRKEAEKYKSLLLKLKNFLNVKELE